jgi:hypothetical protein
MSGGIINEALWMVWKLWFQNGLRRSPRGKMPPPEPPKKANSSAKPQQPEEKDPAGKRM